MLKLKKISKDYFAAGTRIHALKNIDLEFRKSEFVSILGPSGCGKTTLLNLIGGLDKYTGGDLLVNNKSTKNFSDKDWDSYRNYNVGFVFQNYNLIGHLSILQNVELALSLAGITKKEREHKALKALENVGLKKEVNKSPNQLSGGQMQRVAIARALVNDPDILLADEPTGALDTKTSVQIMDIIKEIAKDRLVIMVTHNPTLAKEYSSRIITLLDGEVTGDDNPYTKSLDEEVTPLKNKGTSMSFLTALSLSFRNLRTKKVKTLITAIAGSIGIIGVALVLSLSNGFNNYIAKLQTDTLSSNPLTISEGSVDQAALISAFLESGNNEKYPSIEKIFNNKISEKMTSSMSSNVITDTYVNYIKSFDSSYTYDINYSTGLDVDKNVFTTKDYNGQGNGNSLFQSSSNIAFSEMPDNREFIESQYDIIAGSFPTSKTDLTLIVDSTNTLMDYQLALLGLPSDTDSIDFSSILGKSYYFLDNNQIYTENSDGTFTRKKSVSNDLLNKGLKLTITGILRINKETPMGSSSQGLNYTRDLTNYVLDKNINSKISQFVNENPLINPLTGNEYVGDSSSQGGFVTVSAEDKAREFAGSVGASRHVTSIEIYCKDFASKTSVKNLLDDYNTEIEKQNILSYNGDITNMTDAEINEGKITYNDIMAIFMQSLNQLINIITYVLVAFSSIALAVSSVMIGVITYSSVVERTKEIGILRSVGARKKDISRVFNAETFIIGLYSGVIGIVVTYLLSIPINIILNNKVPNIGRISNLAPNAAIILIAISIVLSLLAGLIPSGIAARKDPVTALRTE